MKKPTLLESPRQATQRVARINKRFKAQEVQNITLETYITQWNLTDLEREHLTYYFLREWTAAELADRISFKESGVPVINIWKRDFMPLWQGNMELWQQILYLAVRGRELLDPLDGPKPLKFWLSFRAGVTEGESFGFVIIQESNK